MGNIMNISKIVGAAAFLLIISPLSAQTISDCELGIQLVRDMIMDPVIASTTDAEILVYANENLDTAIAQCDGTEAGRADALISLANAAESLGHSLP